MEQKKYTEKNRLGHVTSIKGKTGLGGKGGFM